MNDDYGYGAPHTRRFTIAAHICEAVVVASPLLLLWRGLS